MPHDAILTRSLSLPRIPQILPGHLQAGRRREGGPRRQGLQGHPRGQERIRHRHREVKRPVELFLPSLYPSHLASQSHLVALPSLSSPLPPPVDDASFPSSPLAYVPSFLPHCHNLLPYCFHPDSPSFVALHRSSPLVAAPQKRGNPPVSVFSSLLPLFALAPVFFRLDFAPPLPAVLLSQGYTSFVPLPFQSIDSLALSLQ